MAQPYPISRQSREQAVELGSGVATYGPFNFKIFDIEDVEVWTQPATGGVWTLASVTVTKTSGAALDTFSITFASAITASTRYKVLGKRIYERSAGVTKGTRLDPDALEKELSKIAATLQELRRDAGRGIQVQFGDGYILSDSLADGATLMKSGSRIVEGPNAAEIEAAQGYATAAGNSATAAAISAAAAATFDPANFYTKGQADAAFDLELQISSSPVKSSIADGDIFGFLDSAAANDRKRATFSEVISSIFKTARKIANAYFLSSFRVWDATDPTKGLAFNVAGIATATTRTITMPNADVDLSLVQSPDVKAWVNFNGTGTVAIRASKGVSSITDNGVGDYTVNFSSALADSNYGFSVSAGRGTSAQEITTNVNTSVPPTTTAFRFGTTTGAGSATDCSFISAIFFR